MKRVNDPKSAAFSQAAKSFAGAGSAMGMAADAAGLNLDDDRILAYMVNNNHELIWFNEAARSQLFGFASLHPSSEMRNIFLLLGSLPCGVDRELLTLHAGLAKPHLTRIRLAHALRLADDDQAEETLKLFEAAPTFASQGSVHFDYARPDAKGREQNWQAICIFFREGILCAHVPAEAADEVLGNGLGHRGDLIRQLAHRQTPMLTPLGVLVADLQNSVKICAELLPQDYFTLINQIWQTIGPIVRQYRGQVAKHAGDGMVAYFFPHPDGHYLADATACALDIKTAMLRLSREWQIERRWANELYMNIGLHEGQEWLGAVQLGDSVEFTALGDTINTASRLCDFAQFGTIWASKSLVTRLQAETDTILEFGVERDMDGNRRQFVPQSFVQISSLQEADMPSKWRDLGTLAMTEVVGVVPKR